MPDSANSIPNKSLLIKTTTILIEILSVVFAVLVALGVDEWWEERENRQLAERIHSSILAEIEQNRAEIQETNDLYTATYDSLVLFLPRSEVDLEDVHINLTLAVLTSATWRTAQMQFLDVMGDLAAEDLEANPKN